MDDEVLSFSAELEEKGFVEGMNKLLEAIHGMAEEVKKTGMTVDQFSTKALASFDTMTAAINRQAQAQGRAGKAGRDASEAERQGADNATEAIGRTGRATDELGRKLQKAGDEGSVSFGKMAKYAAGFFTLQKAKEFGQKMFDVRKEMESLQVSFETLAGADVGKQLYEDIKQFTLNTPMMMGDFAKGAQTLLGFNIEAQKVMPILKQIGDISMGDSQKFNSLTLAFAQMSSTGKLMGQDLLQMINAGFNPLVVISEKTGKSVAELKDEMSKGAISVEMVEEAFRSATEEGGKFHGMLEQQSKTLGGAYSNLLGAIDEMFNEIGEKSEGIMAGAIDTATLLARNYEMVGKVIIGLVATYGTYKAAVMTVTAVERIQALSRLAHIKQMTLLQLATDILTRKTALLNATMLANPYVLAATAIGALVSAMVIGIKHTDVLADGQKKLNETYAEAEGAAAKEQRKIDDLFGTLRKAKNGTEEWKNAKSAILSQYGGYLKRLGTEVSSLKDVESAYRAVSRAARDAAMARGMEAAIGNINNDYGDTYSKNFDKIRNSLKSRYGEDFASKQMNLLRIHMQRNGGLISDNNKEALKGIMRGTSDYGNMDSWVTALNNAEKNRQQLLKEAQEKFGKLNAQIFDAAENPEGTGKHNVRNKRAIEEDKKKAQAELDSLEAIDAAGKKGAALRKKIAGYNKELESYSASSDKKAATEAAKQWKETVKSNAATIQEERRYQEELDKYTLQAEQARSDARIAAIRNDAERERAEQDEQHRRSLQQIAELADEMRKAIYEHNKKAWEAEHKDSPYELTEEGGKGWKEISLSDDQQSIINARLKKENAEYSRLLEERRRSERQSMYDYIKEYGSIQQQRLAITKEYDEKISETKDATQKAVLEQRKKQDLSSVDYNAIQQSIDWESVFNDIERLSTGALRSIREKLKAALNVGDITPENAKVLSEKILEIEDRISERSNVWSSLIPALKERERITRQIAQAEDEVTRATNESAEAIMKMHAAEVNAQKVIKERTGKDVSLDDFRAKTADEIVSSLGLSDLKNANGENVKSIEDITQAINAAIIAVTDATEAEENLTQARGKSQNLKDILGGFKGKGIGGAISDIFKNATGNFSAMGIVNMANQNVQSLAELTETLNLSETHFGTFVNDFASATSSFTSSVQSLASGDVAGAINGVVKGFEGLGRSFGNILGIAIDADYSSYNRLVEQYDELIGVWDELIDRKSEYIGMSYGAETLKVGREALDLIEKQAEAYRELGKERLNAGSSAGSSSIGRRISKNMDAGDWKGIADSLGWSVDEAKEFIGTSRMTGLFDLTAEQIKALQEGNQVWWAKLDDDVRKYLESIIENEEKWSAAQSQMMQQLTTTTEDNVFSGFLDDLYGIADGSEEVFDNIAESWQQMVNRMVINNLVGARFQESLKGWYDDLYKAMQKRSENGDNKEFKSDIDRLQKEYEDYVREAQEEIEVLRGVGIISGSAEAKEDKNASNVMADKATYDQFEKYLGIATAQQITEEQIRSILQRWDGNISPVVNLPESQSPVVNVETKADNKEALLIIENLRSIADITSSNGSTTREIRELVKTSNEYLLDIKKSNREILEAMTVRVDNLYNLMEKKL